MLIFIVSLACYISYFRSVGEQSFEESLKSSKDPRGIFNQYLLEVLEKKGLNASQVFHALQTSRYKPTAFLCFGF